MTAGQASLAAAKAEYEQQVEVVFQTEGLFEDLDPPPVFRSGAAKYLLQLVAVPFRRADEPEDPAWTVWALAPVDNRWDAWSQHVARDRDRGWLDGIEHVWLTRDGVLRRALVHIHTGTILQPRPTPGTSPAPKEEP